MLLDLDLDDPELQEALSRAAYYRQKFDDMIADQEHVNEAEYFCLRWEQLPAMLQRPYRVAVDLTLRHVTDLISVG